MTGFEIPSESGVQACPSKTRTGAPDGLKLLPPRTMRPLKIVMARTSPSTDGVCSHLPPSQKPTLNAVSVGVEKDPPAISRLSRVATAFTRAFRFRPRPRLRQACPSNLD